MIYNLKNAYLEVSILDVGASILSIQYLGKETTLQYDSLDTYQVNPYYLNSVIGPHAGRIKGGRYELDGKEIALETGSGGNHLHGGSTGFHTLVFKESVYTKDSCILEAYDSYNRCFIKLSYTLIESDLKIEFEVESEIDQVMNMTQHTYFNLSGEDTVMNHEITVDAQRFSALDETGVPIGLMNVEGPFDLRKTNILASKMVMEHPQFEITDNIDTAFEVNQGGVDIYSSLSDVGVNIQSNRPFAVIYTSNYFLGDVSFKGLGPSIKYQAIAVEPQYLPNDVNLKLGANQILRVGEIYKQKIQYYFYHKGE